jgi:serine/threonine-protein kinase
VSREQSARPSTADDTADTRLLSRDFTPTRPVPALATTTRVGSPVDAMRLDEVGRIHLFARMIIPLSLLGFVLVPLLRGDSVAKNIFLGSLTVVFVTYVWLFFVTRSPDTYKDLHVAIVSQVQGLASHGAAYFFGVFGPYPALAAVGIYVFSLGSSMRISVAGYINLALGHGLLAALIMSGTLADRGLVRADYLGMREQVALQLCVQAVFLICLLLGRMGRKRTEHALEELEQAVHAVAQREALLNEAKGELARAIWVGGPGRYTDQVVGSYRLGVVVGRGGMGVVYEAEHVEDRSPAAVKLLHDVGDNDQMRQFVREATAAGALDSPNVVSVLEVSEPDSPLPYLAMERLVGEDLGEILRERPSLPISEVTDMVHAVAAGLQAAQDAAIVHRDLKPQNIFRALGTDGSVEWKILDFGVSKISAEAGTLTRGHVIGTPAYMPPEQASSGRVDARADLYSLAVITYRALTGSPPFSGRGVPQVLYDVVHRMPERPTTLAPDLPWDIDAVLAIGMAKRPKNRFTSARVFAAALSQAADGRLDPDSRERANALIERHPWDSVR